MKFSAWSLNPFNPQLGEIPVPPPMPHYDPQEEAPLWDYARLRDRITKTPGSDLWPNRGGRPKDDDSPDWRGVVKNNIDVWELPKGYHWKGYQGPYCWWDTPDYADPFKKLWWSFKWSIWTGTVAYAIRGILDGEKFSWSHHKSLMGRAFAPYFIIGMTGSLSVVTIANLRGRKDDYLNYIVGGIIASLVVGRNDFHKGFRYMVWTPLFAVLAKHTAENNLYLLPTFNFRARGVSTSGASAEHGPKSGDFRFVQPYKSGRDIRDFPRA